MSPSPLWEIWIAYQVSKGSTNFKTPKANIETPRKSEINFTEFISSFFDTKRILVHFTNRLSRHRSTLFKEKEPHAADNAYTPASLNLKCKIKLPIILIFGRSGQRLVILVQ